MRDGSGPSGQSACENAVTGESRAMPAADRASAIAIARSDMVLRSRDFRVRV